MTVRAESEVNKIEHRRHASDRAQRCGIACGCRVEVRRLHRHRVDLLRTQRGALEQTFAQVREVAVEVAFGRDALVHLQHVHPLPRHVLAPSPSRTTTTGLSPMKVRFQSPAFGISASSAT